ncbi:MAG: TetR/AcrR family transcriptional regulator [Ruminiclostridium sp.]
MPKVSTEYVNKKKDDILEAALSVFKTKPLYEITMKDIIKASGVSQGGIYLYYSDINDILISLINKSNANSDYEQSVDSIIEGSTSPKDVIERLFAFLGEYIEQNTGTVGKIQFELGVLFTNHPERQEKILPKITEQQSGQYLMEQLIRKIYEGISSDYFIPALPAENIIIFIMASIDGICRNVVLQECYGLSQGGQLRFNAISLMKTLSKSVLLMLGCT